MRHWLREVVSILNAVCGPEYVHQSTTDLSLRGKRVKFELSKEQKEKLEAHLVKMGMDRDHQGQKKVYFGKHPKHSSGSLTFQISQQPERGWYFTWVSDL